ncbi:MAG: carbohydrate-binding protein, partial [Planctomycetota bacterium]
MRRITVLTLLVLASGSIAAGQTVTVVPDPPQAAQNLTITYDPTCRPLEGEAEVYTHYGFNGWHPTVDPDPLMTDNAGLWEVTVAVPAQATEINIAFHTAGDPDVWDNQDGENWNLAVTGGVPNPPSVSTAPDPVLAAQNVTVSYDPAGGPLSVATAVYLHYGFNNWFPTITPDLLMTDNAGVWEATVPVKSYASEFDVVFLDDEPTPNWDTNDGFDWRLAVDGTVSGVSVSPDPPVAGQDVTITYNPEDSPLEGAATIYLHWGINDFAVPRGPDVLMDVNTTGVVDVWEATVSLPKRACRLAFVFNDGADTWDSNNGNDWSYDCDDCRDVSEAAGLYLAKYIDEFDPFFNMLYVGVGGNLQSDGSAIVVFINTPGMTGQVELQADGVATPPNLLPLASKRIDLVSCGTVGTGTILPGEADYALYANYAAGQVHLNQYKLSASSLGTLTCCDGSSLDVYAAQVSLGSTDVNDGNIALEVDEGFGYEGGFDDTNVSTDPSLVATGLEVGIPMYLIGDGLEENDDVNVFVAVMPNNGGVQGQFNNQTLPPSDDTAGYCDPAAMFPLRADMSAYSAFLSTNVATLPGFTGLADGTIDPAEYNGTADSLQTCPVADPVPDTTVALDPAPVQGQDVTISYDPTGRPLEAESEIYLHYGYDGWTQTVVPDVLMTEHCGLWEATVSVSTDGLQLDMNFNNGAGTDDDNLGQDWAFEISRPAAGPTVVINPDPAVAGQNVTITYDPLSRPLENASAVTLHYGFNGWNPVMPDEPMTRTLDCKWEVTVAVASFAAGPQGLNVVFHDGQGSWDSNDGNDWHFTVENPQEPPPWEMDGHLDGCATLVASSADESLHLYAGMWDGFLYVATDRAQNDNDHFIFVAETPGVAAGQPWAKAGTVAQWDAYLAQEMDNGWNGWFDMEMATQRGNSPQSMDLPILEGYFDVAAELTAVPSTIHLAMGPYPTANGTTLVGGLQIPPGNGDGNIDADEYLAVDMLDIQVPPEVDPAVDCNSNGTPDLCDPIADMVSAKSCLTHDLTEWCLDMPDDGVEPRFDGVQKLDIDWSGPVNLSTMTVGVSCIDNDGLPVAYGGTATVTAGAGNLVHVNLSEPLPDQTCCTVSVDDCISSGSRKIRSLAGDVSRDGEVSVSDKSLIKPKIGATLDALNFSF